MAEEVPAQPRSSTLRAACSLDSPAGGPSTVCLDSSLPLLGGRSNSVSEAFGELEVSGMILEGVGKAGRCRNSEIGDFLYRCRIGNLDGEILFHDRPQVVQIVDGVIGCCRGRLRRQSRGRRGRQLRARDLASPIFRHRKKPRDERLRDRQGGEQGRAEQGNSESINAHDYDGSNLVGLHEARQRQGQRSSRPALHANSEIICGDSNRRHETPMGSTRSWS
jgi:hypothetical protein